MRHCHTCLRSPGTLPAGTTSGAMLETIDLLPTFARLIGGQLPEHKIDGLDVWPIISGQPDAKNPHPGYAFYYEENQLQAVTTGDGRWKLVFPHRYRTRLCHICLTNTLRSNNTLH